VKRLQGKRVLVTQSSDYMGPAIIELFREHGADVIADETDLREKEAAGQIVDSAGRIDVLVAKDAFFALFLASSESDFFVGQAIPFSGGWAQ
jgi:NAD(P)-dependent dehydrogenase (short-subunit alcohol dehydrogenase family)